MQKFSRFRFQPVRPLGPKGRFVTGCKAHKAMALQAAADGAVLLKNDGTLPLAPGSKVCMFGSGTGEFLFGGGGSGQLVADNPVTLAQALASETEFFQPLADFHVAFTHAEYAEARTKGHLSWWRRFRNIRTPEIPEDLYKQAVEFGGTAIFCISRFSSEGTDCGDRNGQEGDFDLWGNELQLLRRLYRDFEKVVVVINTCGPVSVTEYEEANALLYAPYGGYMGGIALKELLLGQRCPSGHLQDTLAKTLSDYPSTASFLESKDYVNYEEDIFVGYRYFETFAPEKVAYPFGFGLGYTTFALSLGEAALEKNTVSLTATVKNTGTFPGREVVQAYLEAPQGLLGKAKKVLCAFEKTKELAPGQEATVKLRFDIRQFGSFDDTGKLCESAFVLEKGKYLVHVGCNVRDTREAFAFTLAEDIICKKCHSYMAPTQLPRRLNASGSFEALPPAPLHKHPIPRYKLKTTGAGKMSLARALEKGLEDDFLANLPDDQLCELVYGHAVTNAANCAGIGLQPRESWPDELIPLVPVADGPAGMRTIEGSGIYTTWLPCETAIAQTWDLPLCARMGKIAGLEIKENNAGAWLAPGMNIHRNVLCGRNFEYYSEDPLVTGLMAAAAVKGCQSVHIAATVKHYCANNKDVNRKYVDSRVSQRALREIYLRGFEIAVKKAKPWAVMTSYNPVNGVQASANWEAIQGILKNEWGFDGVVMTDWDAFSNIIDELYAGSDVKMPGLYAERFPDADRSFDPVKALADGTLDRGAVYAAAKRVLKLMNRLE